jgi:hypothetical protein
MAKILLVSKKITPTSWQLAQALKFQQHDVTFLTSYGESIENSENIQILSFFKKWNAFEMAQLVPALMSLSPQIVHFVLEDDRVTAAHMMLWAYTQTRPETVFTISLLHIARGLRKRNWVRYLIQQADIVTCPSVDMLAHLRGIDVKSHRQGRGLLPPVLTMGKECPAEENELSELLQGQKYIVRPFAEKTFDPNSAYFTDLLKMLEHYKVVLFGSQDHWHVRDRKRFQQWLTDHGVGDKWYLTGLTSVDHIKCLVKEAEAFWLADLDLSPLELTEFYLQAIEVNSTLILDPKQARLHAPLWRNGQNCWILGEVTRDELFSKKSLKLSYEFEDLKISRKDLVDAPLNELNRLYNKALSLKANP